VVTVIGSPAVSLGSTGIGVLSSGHALASSQLGERFTFRSPAATLPNASTAPGRQNRGEVGEVVFADGAAFV
jgi:hypothetical protein